ncbi:VOC family protein [Microbacterium sp. ARD31]|uniref:VOC family protein n=1 Tax=Microbacterium sp. ARD31 TaxID=2962576 RepID=UPI0028817E8A|nr:VOC family protein [Microbacterium sp. ARD31]MDT0186805.1 VOC family protein [Microbacterium sp. ARD31]
MAVPPSWLHVVLDVPPEVYDAQLAFWSAALGWQPGAPWPGHPELRSLEPDAGERHGQSHVQPYVHVQEIEGPPRVHLDVEVPDPVATLARAAALGAEVVSEHDRWTTLASPGGLPFCVLRSAGPEEGRVVPGPVKWTGGHRGRLVQVCVDAPAAAFDSEVAFWRDLLPGRWVDSPSPEFAGKWHDGRSPLQLLFQRLDEPDGAVRAHLDHGTDDLDAEVGRLLALGAEDVGRGRGWHTMRDPAGLAFCATENSPSATGVRDLG